MKTTYSLGRVAGIEIGLNWSVLGLLALLMWTLATGIFPSTNPGLGDNAYFAMAVVASLAFFASILLHELGHALQARRDGVRIEGITLWLFGGVARFAGMFPSAGVEFRIAIAGPLVSLALGGGFVGVALIPGLPEPVDGVCSWLGFTNLVLLVFNLVPALPLDGGRMLRAALWRGTGDLQRATRLAAGAGRVLALSLIGLGIAIVALGDAASGIWMAFIGWFVLQAAGAEARYVVQQAAAALRVRDMMVADPVTTTPDLTLGDFAGSTGRGLPHEAYPVVDDGRVVGLFPLRCLDEVPRDEWGTLRVADCMLSRERTPILSADDGIPAALAALEGAEPQSALVLDGERLVGLLSVSDIARALRSGHQATA
jgi:Zn-dependent protease/CBS domain-containing protein